jgi:hypothetical protein
MPTAQYAILHPFQNYSAYFSPDGTLLGARQPDGALPVWRIGTPEPVERLMPIAPRSAEQNDSAARFIFSADNQVLITNGAGGVNFYRLADGQMLRRLELAAQDIAIGPAGRLFAVLENGRVALWGVPEA